ncbi:MAG: hypothetical protein HOP27_13695 [Anaerolineales bacterium]|nr:hypothetical protein [Anaerolineales bacterium]
MNNISSDLVINVLVAILGAIVLKVWEILKDIIPARRLWGFKSPKKMIICVSANSHDDDNYPMRPGSGGGQIRALGLIQKSLERAYKPPDLVRNILLSTDQLGRHLERDMVILGGPEYNQMAKKMMYEVENSPVRQSDHKITWHEANQERVFVSEFDGDRITKDYGLVLHVANPYSNGKSTVVVFSGCHAYGTLAAAYYFTEVMLSQKSFGGIKKNNFAMVVSAPVIDGWVPKPKLIHYVEWAN